MLLLYLYFISVHRHRYLGQVVLVLGVPAVVEHAAERQTRQPRHWPQVGLDVPVTMVTINRVVPSSTEQCRLSVNSTNVSSVCSFCVYKKSNTFNKTSQSENSFSNIHTTRATLRPRVSHFWESIVCIYFLLPLILFTEMKEILIYAEMFLFAKWALLRPCMTQWFSALDTLLTLDLIQRTF